MLRSVTALCVVLLAAVSIQGQAGVVVFDGARILDGNGGAPIENGRLVIQGGRVTAVGPASSVTVPSGATRVDLSGKTIMPAMINVHAHMGYEGYTSWGARNHTAENLLDHLQREAFYGVASATSVGSSPTEMALQFQRDQQAGKFAPAARFLFMPGFAPPNGGPDHILKAATDELHVINEVTTVDEVRQAIRRMAGQNIANVKIWFDDRGGTYPKLSPEIYQAIIREAHDHKMTVHTHAIQLADQKTAVSSGTDVLVHMVQNAPIDQEFQALLAAKKPYWATVISLGDPVEVCNADPFFEQALPAAVVAQIRANQQRVALTANCAPPSPNAMNRERILAQNFPLYIAAGVKLVLATDTGLHPGHTFGSGEHVEIARWVQLGLSPAQAIVAATKTPAQLMGLTDLGTLTAGKRASFIVLDDNPLVNIRNTRKIADVYLDGVKLDRPALLRKFRQM
jgi:imidazolonepropionase-like amidohydrolase